VTINIETFKTFCIVCIKEIPKERRMQRSITCSKECKAVLRKFYRAVADSKKCRLCAKPSTLEERRQYKLWLKATNPVKLGRPKKAK
jgi:predicted nucleic acid-binding Zn ribbon protein